MHPASAGSSGSAQDSDQRTSERAGGGHKFLRNAFPERSDQPRGEKQDYQSSADPEDGQPVSVPLR